MSSYGAQNGFVCFLSSIILTKESFKIKSKDVWFAGKGGTISIMSLSLGGILKLGEGLFSAVLKKGTLPLNLKKKVQ